MSFIKEQTVRLLRWTERYIKTDMVYLVSRSSFSVFGQFVIALATLVFATVVGHVLSQEAYGEYKYVLSIISLLSLFTLNNLNGAVFQSTAQGYGGALWKGFFANIRWSFVVFLGALGLAGYYFTVGNSKLAAEILIGGSLSPFIASASLYSPYLAGKKAFIRQMLYTVIDNVLTTGIMIVTVLLSQSPLILVAAYFVSNALAALIFFYRTIQLYDVSLGESDPAMLTFSKQLSVLGILGGIVETIDQILVFHFAGAAQLAIFAFATALPDQMKTPLKTLDTMMQAGFVGRTPREIHGSIKHKMFWYFIFLAAVCTVYILIAPFIFHIFFPTYSDSLWYSQIYILWILTVAIDPVLSYFGSRRKVRELYAGGIFFMTCQAITMVVGVIWWGILGLVIAQVATRILSAFVNYALYLRIIYADIAQNDRVVS